MPTAEAREAIELTARTEALFSIRRTPRGDGRSHRTCPSREFDKDATVLFGIRVGRCLFA